MTTVPTLARTATMLTLALLLGSVDGASAGVIGPDASLRQTGSDVVAVQYGYGYGYRPYRPYGFYARRRYYNNHFGPGAAKERYRTRLDYCRNQPSRC